MLVLPIVDQGTYINQPVNAAATMWAYRKITGGIVVRTAK